LNNPEDLQVSDYEDVTNTEHIRGSEKKKLENDYGFSDTLSPLQLIHKKPMFQEDLTHEDIMDQIVKEMGLDSESFLSKKYNVQTGKLNIRAKKSEQRLKENSSQGQAREYKASVFNE